MLHMTLRITEYISCVGVVAEMYDRDDMGASHWLGTTVERFFEHPEYGDDPQLAVLIALREWANVHIPPESLALAGREKTRNAGTAGGGVAGNGGSAPAKPAPSRG
jgi:hypothetical protein